MDDEVRTNTSKKVKLEVEEFVKKVLNDDEIYEANKVIELAFSKNKDEQNLSGDILSSLIPRVPKRPLRYVNDEVYLGPRMVTRHVVHYLCAYLNAILDVLAKDIGGYKRFIPFGVTLKKIKGKISDELYNKLDTYNRIFYVPAKHNFDPYDDSSHLFSLKDAIYCCYITMKLKDEMTAISEPAKISANGKYDMIKEKI